MNKKNSFTKEELLSCGRGEMFDPGNAQLPLPPMLMFDRIVSITDTGGTNDKGQLVAELDITPDLWFFECHFEGDPVMPGCLGLDAMWQLVGAPGRGRALGAGNVKFTGQVTPSTRLVTYEINMRRVMLRKLVMGVADGRMLADDREIYTAKDLRVGLFTSTEEF